MPPERQPSTRAPDYQDPQHPRDCRRPDGACLLGHWPAGRSDARVHTCAVVGSGRIGSLRARMAAAHPAVKFLAVSDLDAERVACLAKSTGADFSSGDNEEVIRHPRVNAVIVSTSEHEHLEPVMRALELGKPVLVEKPIALSLADADRIIAKAQDTGTPIRVGYAQRFSMPAPIVNKLNAEMKRALANAEFGSRKLARARSELV